MLLRKSKEKCQHEFKFLRKDGHFSEERLDGDFTKVPYVRLITYRCAICGKIKKEHIVV